jgi:superfamily I DNA and RNA helicase
MRTVDSIEGRAAEQQLKDADAELEHIFSLLFSRLLRNRALRRAKTELVVRIGTIIYAPGAHVSESLSLEAKLATSPSNLAELLRGIRSDPLPQAQFAELIATLEGAKAIIRPKLRDVANLGPRSKGVLASRIESEIAEFDLRQKHGAMAVLDGLQRIRGLAGSGKTIILAMKAALTHLREPEARIVYTFYTKSLYQHIQRLITRFYRQFDDKDPDWSRVRVLHGWGGRTSEGVYYNASIANNVAPVTLREAKAARALDPFDYVCTKLLSSVDVKPAYDYVFVDEGQDFPASFIRLCIKLAESNRVVFAYDELQTIFQPSTPELKDIVGEDTAGRPVVDLTQDVVLYKCYRNPREILVCAHALGFGLYRNIVQMLENSEQWRDIGYEVLTGDFIEGSRTEIERPAANSLPTISMNQPATEIVKASVYDTFADEVTATADSIVQDLSDGLRPDDILVIVVDDRFAKGYLTRMSQLLRERGILSNNIHDDTFGIRDFQLEGQVTLSTVHKAKGNEAFMVYVLGVDALYSTYAAVRERNVLFTAMTRAKGWVRVSGLGNSAQLCKDEIDEALRNLPRLVFTYPGPEQLKIIKRDLEEKSARKQRAERKLDEILDEMTTEEVIRFLEQRSTKKGKI